MSNEPQYTHCVEYVPHWSCGGVDFIPFTNEIDARKWAAYLEKYNYKHPTHHKKPILYKMERIE